MKYLTFLILLVALTFLLALRQYKLQEVSSQKLEVSFIDSPQKATIRPEEQEKFIKAFRENEKSLEAWGLFSYGGFSDAGQFKVFLTKKVAKVYYCDSQLMSGRKSSQDGHLSYAEFLLDKKEPSWKSFYQTITNLQRNLEGFQITHFDAFQFDFLHLTKSKNKVQLERVYFDDPYLREKKTKKLQDLLAAFEKLIKKEKTKPK